MTLSAGTRLGPYEILASLDAGGMGEVYRATDPRIGRDVAIKVLPAVWSHDRDRLRRFEREARAAGALSHPALLTIYDVGDQDGTPYLVSELLEGETLRTRLLGGPLSPRRAIEYAIQIARGLAVAHGRGIVHRDIKPENLFITKDGRVKILDFGLAKLRLPKEGGSQGPTARHQTEPGTVMGTAGYMSPEQVRGVEVDQRSDIFSLGAVLYEALTGSPPFKRDSSVETMNAILKEEPAELTATNRHISPALTRVVSRCLEKHREARYQSAADLAFHLEDLTDISVPGRSSANVPGELLSERLRRGPLGVLEAARVTLGVLTALERLHERAVVHSDLKPSNVILTEQSVKLLDSDPVAVESASRYAAPEQFLGHDVDRRCDLFSVGALLYEMVSGSPAFGRNSLLEERHAVADEDPPNLAGSEAIAALNSIIHRALAKNRENRYQSAAAMARDIRAAMLIADIAAPIVARRMTRLVVLPFRILRPDPETDFLALALPVAITSSLTGLQSLVMRSPAAAGAFASDSVDLAKLRSDLDVDLVMTGTMMRGGDQLRVTTELAEVPTGTVAWSYSAQLALTDLFQLQDELTRRIIGSLQLPLTEREQRLLRRDVPASPRAHEFYLRAGQLTQSTQEWLIARDLYLRALDEDPHYAPAWARLARIYLLLGKYVGNTAEHFASAESALRKALEINGELPIAHHVYALLEVAVGRAQDAVVRLLELVAQGTNDADVFAGLVIACRYCGLLEASSAAHDQARRLDARASTSASHTYWMFGQYDRA
ncbi:MAG TPA: protein kinase, partial [Thermoanaerobaculia bacterium]